MQRTFSIITVVYKDLIGLKKTIKSILDLNSSDIEHIIIDGNSGKETVKYLESCENLYKRKKIKFTWISESDKGIYDAMNKGISISNGRWLNFMNAGDIFVGSETLNEIKSYLENSKLLVYGNKIQNNKIIKPLPLNYLKAGIIMACHQSMFFNKKNLGEELVYNTRYKIYADYELVNRIYKNDASKIIYLDKEISIYQGGGISESVSYQKRKDKLKIVLKSYGFKGVIKTYVFKFSPNLVKL